MTNTPSKAALARVDAIIMDPDSPAPSVRLRYAIELDRISEIASAADRLLKAFEYTEDSVGRSGLRSLILPPDEPTPAEVLVDARIKAAEEEAGDGPWADRMAAALDAMGYEIRRKG